MQVIEMFADDDLRNYLYQQIESFKNYDRLEFQESLVESSLGALSFHQTLTFDKYKIDISSGLDRILMAIETTEIDNIEKLYWELAQKYIW